MKRVARIWYCGDDYCDCCQAIVEDIYPHPRFPKLWAREQVAAGPFYTDGEGWNQVYEDLEALAKEYGVEL